MRVGIEVGGTFTDLVAIDDDGIRVTKVPSTPQQPDLGAFSALIESGLTASQIDDLAHGSTIATNAVLERKGARIAFVTTRGFRDILLLQRHGRNQIYDLEYQKPKPVVARADTFEVDERILSDGQVLRPLDRQDFLTSLLLKLTDGAYGAIAVCLLNAYVNPAHEREIRDLIAQNAPDLHVSISSHITREFREFERASTTTLSAYVQPVVDRYIARFAARLDEHEFKGRFSIMQSNGGRLPSPAMRGNAINALLSGPAAGVIGAARQAARSGYRNLITLDMGGTSTDVCVVTDGKPQLTQEFQIEGLPVRIPIVDIKTIGAGGGSIIWVDDGGMLRVGPQSAGAEPGPACYGRGGTQPTLTDAQVVRGTVRPEAFLGGRMSIDAKASRRVLEPVAARFGLTVEQAAESAVALGTANVVRAIQIISTERGLDPRDYVLSPFGGAGPLHAASVAEELGIETVVVPPSAGVVSAYGLIASDFTQFASQTHRALADETAAETVRSIYAAMKDEAVARAANLNLGDALVFELIADMRFVGQAFEIAVPIPVEDVATLTAGDVRRRFSEAHHRVYMFGGDASRPVEFVSFRLGVTAPLDVLPLLEETAVGNAVKRSEINLFVGGAWRNGQLIARSDLEIGGPIKGPALLEDPTSTLFLPEGWVAERDAHSNTIMRKGTRT